MKTLLVVEDDRAIGTMLRQILEDSYAVTLVERTGAMPDDLAAALVITDLNVHGAYDSASAVRTVRESRLRTGAPVLVLTAHGAAKADGELATVADAVLTKPFQLDELLAVVERLVV